MYHPVLEVPVFQGFLSALAIRINRHLHLSHQCLAVHPSRDHPSYLQYPQNLPYYKFSAAVSKAVNGIWKYILMCAASLFSNFRSNQ